MNTTLGSMQIKEDIKIGKVYAKERSNDFSIIMRLIIAASLFFSIAVTIF
ncbi:MAG: hypothetical protein N3D80_05335 [Ignavibacterium album]|nr:hypothetical protein [Ignavibacterium album]MCX8105282.1 hypothetical protein [Ignavibacterium album]